MFRFEQYLEQCISSAAEEAALWRFPFDRGNANLVVGAAINILVGRSSYDIPASVIGSSYLTVLEDNPDLDPSELSRVVYEHAYCQTHPN